MARQLRRAACGCVGGCVAVVAPPSSAPKAATLGGRGQVDEKRVALTSDPERGRSATALDGGATTAGLPGREGLARAEARRVGQRGTWRAGGRRSGGSGC